ncbi:MAG: flavin reductase family protein [Burkholderiaceae bacterium]
MFFDLAATPDFKRTLFNAIVAPRPIGWISSLGPQGTVNLAPFSHFNLVSTAPPVLIFSCNTPADRARKDTVENVRASGEFVANLVTRGQAEAMNATSAPVPYGVDEFELAGIEKAPSVLVAPPRVAGSPAALECRVLRFVEIEPEGPGETMSTVVFGRVVGVHIADGFLDERGRFDTARARPLTRLGGNQYAEAGPVFELPSAFVKV